MEAFVLLIGLLTPFGITYIGTFQVSELLTFAILPFLLATQPQRALRRGIIPIYSLMGLWLLCQIITDIYRHTERMNWMRGDARVIFFAIDLTVLTILLSKKIRRQVLFVAGFGVGSLLAAVIQPPDGMSEAPWKFGYSTGTMTLVVLLCCYFHARKRYWATGALLAALVAVNLLLNFRSPILFLMVTIALVVPAVPERVGRLRLLPRAGTPKRVVVLITFAVGFVVLSLALVKFVTDVGLISAGAQEKNRNESQSIGGLLIGGRPEILVSSRAVMDSPILGHGSWASDFKYTEMLYDIAIQYNIPIDSLDYIEQSDLNLIPAHSHIMSSWVQAGIFGAVFWIYILYLAIRGLIRTALVQPVLAPYYAFLMAGFVWDALFSPFNNLRRFVDSLVIIFVLEVLEMYPRRSDNWRPFRKWKRYSVRGRLAPTVTN
ncbi:MAG TPA: O-antigen ligase family protein [Terracidiphilus sp.]|nr:O-antigen ligase family protein [Terracidiphilus sp.]